MRLLLKKREQSWRSLVFIFFIVFFIWILLQILAPLLLPTGSVPDLSGSVGITDNEQMIQNMSFPWNVVYTAGDRLCHQKGERSLFLNGNEMPFCSRCTGIWLGIVIGLWILIFYQIELNNTFLVLLLMSLVPIGIDGLGQLLGFWESQNAIRFITGLLAGTITGMAIGIIIDEARDLLRKKKE